MENDLTKKYEGLKKKFNLPDFDEIDSEFEISSIEDTHFLLKKICSKIDERINEFMGLLEEIFQSEGSLRAMHELRYLDDDEKKEIYRAYKQLMKCNREYLLIVLESDEKSQSEFIRQKLSEWREIKKDLKKFVEKMKSSWEMETDIEEDLRYLG